MSYSEEVLSLHKYFIAANKMRIQYYNLLEVNSKDLRTHEPFNIEEMTFMSLWYGMLYVVAEGYVALKLQDERIDIMLKSPNLDLLRKFRNGTFHFQESYYNKKILGFIAEGAKSSGWIINLHDEFSRFLLKEIEK